MVITIRNIDDFIRALRENEDFQAAARRELLTQDLLELPGEFREYRATAEERFDAVQEDVEVVRRDINGIGESYRREVRAQSSFRGNYAQSAARGEDLEIASLFARRHGLEDIYTRHVSADTRRTWLRTHRSLVESLNLGPRARRTFLRPDMIAAVVDLYAGDDAEPAFYIVVESSYTGDVGDIERATNHARIIRGVTGLNAYAVAAAVTLDDEMDATMRNRLYDDVNEFVDAHDESAALWHRLDSADLRPPEPR